MPSVEAAGSLLIRDKNAHAYFQFVVTDLGDRPALKEFKTNHHKWDPKGQPPEYVKLGPRKTLMVLKVKFVGRDPDRPPGKDRDTDQVTVTVTNGMVDATSQPTPVTYVDPA